MYFDRIICPGKFNTGGHILFTGYCANYQQISEVYYTKYWAYLIFIYSCFLRKNNICDGFFLFIINVLNLDLICTVHCIVCVGTLHTFLRLRICEFLTTKIIWREWSVDTDRRINKKHEQHEIYTSTVSSQLEVYLLMPIKPTVSFFYCSWI